MPETAKLAIVARPIFTLSVRFWMKPCTRNRSPELVYVSRRSNTSRWRFDFDERGVDMLGRVVDTPGQAIVKFSVRSELGVRVVDDCVEAGPQVAVPHCPCLEIMHRPCIGIRRIENG